MNYKFPLILPEMLPEKAYRTGKFLWAMRRFGHISTWVHDRFNLPQRKADLNSHLNAGIDWICAAHDSCGQKGVSAMYSFPRGWFPPYPETTGYIIPTLFSCADFLKREDLFSRAIRMADWETEIQMGNGAYQGMYWNPDRKTDVQPAVFNTGQIMLGLTRAYELTGNHRYWVALEKAANFLVSIQESDGSWRKHLGPTTRASVYSYNSRAGYALILAGTTTGERDFIVAGERNISWTIRQQKGNGWFVHSAFLEGSNPLTHTLCYCVEGILEAGLLLKNESWIHHVRLCADAMMNVYRKKGMLPATLDENWESADNYQCVTGNCQIALIWLLIYRATGTSRYYEEASKMIDFLIGLQNMDSKNTGIRGGMKGSHPIGGDYIPYALVSWAAKFFVDVLLLKMNIDSKKRHDQKPTLDKETCGTN